ncbi:threonine--tRNA ligase [Candidatus Micrarchaeota archaeon]|nr:threonine--tRNA ligase [Candidatus Micrarchaeota archaeon]
MRLLELHCETASYKPRTKALKSVADLKPEEKTERKYSNVLVVFTTVEKNDSRQTVEQAAAVVEKNFREVKADNLLVYPYAHLSNDLAPPSDAVELLDYFHQQVKKFCKPAEKSPFGWYKQFSINVLGHPLSELSKTIGAGAGNEGKLSVASVGKDGKIEAAGSGKASFVEEKQVVIEAGKKDEESQSLKAESTLKTYFKILTPQGELIDPSEFDYSKHPGLKKFADYEIKKVRAYAKEPPHIKLMREHKLVSYEPASDSGQFRWLPKGLVIKKTLEKKVSDWMVDYGALQVETPIMYDYAHPALKKYLHRFPARQYTVESDEKKLFLRFSACFGQFLAVHDAQISYKQLPLKVYELTHYSFRREQSGELAGLKRLRAFTMPDMHTVCADLSGAKDEFESQYNLCVKWNKELGIEFETAFRAQEDFFEENKEFYLRMVKKVGKPMLIELFNTRYAYFITKFEMNFVDNAEKASGLSTVQIDVENCETFDMSYVDEAGKKQRPVVLHASIPGAVDRVLYALLEREAGKIIAGKTPSFPTWLSPTQVRLIPLSDGQNKDCEKTLKELLSAGIRADFDDRVESMGKKIRNAELEWVPHIVVIGPREVKEGKLAVRERESGKQHEIELGTLIKKINDEIGDNPREKLALPTHLTKRPVLN